MQNPDFSGLPELLRERVARDWASWREAQASKLSAAILKELPRVWACSQFVSEACLREPKLLPSLADEGGRIGPLDAKVLQNLRERLAAAGDEAALKRELRVARRREMVRIAWRDLSGADELEQNLLALSQLADGLIAAAAAWVQRKLAERHGAPHGADGKPLELVVLGMGKLGGSELNFSSDVDLIFCYEQQGETAGARPLSHEEYFELAARKLVQALSDRSEGGIVYRVDTMLRPFGSAGPLAMSFSAMEQYYQTHGREWERYALIKARPITGAGAAGERLLALLKPFVYRRYLDFGSYESLRQMKALIHEQAARKGSADDIKLGPGGIREIEFIAQLFQLIRGGREPRLQQRSLRPVLRQLAASKLLPEKAASELDAAYVFLRRLENRMQAWRDEQLHHLPQDAEAQAALALAMDCPDWPTLARAVAARRSMVEAEFERVFAAPQASAGSTEDDLSARLGALWRDELPAESGNALLAEMGYAEPARSLETLGALRGRIRFRSAGELGRQRLAQVMPLLLAAAARAAQPDVVLERVGEILVAIAGRSAYLALLLEHPSAISQLIRLCAASPWIGEQLALHPQLLDMLLDPRLLYAPPRKAELQAELDEWFEHAGADDTEQHMELLRRFKHTQVLRVAAADVSGSVPLMVVSDHLTEIAEVILGRTLELAREPLAARHGAPQLREGGDAGFVVIAYGKLGGIELGYGSDLDLVFVHAGAPEDLTGGEKPVEQGQFFARLAQRMVHLLTTATGAGQVYEVDLELRPSGRSGLLVTTLNAFAEYQRAQAWTWEHQALVRARAVAGPAALRAEFEALRLQLLTQPRDAAKLREEVLDMRARMQQHRDRPPPGEFDLKQGEGGITDIEFMVQYCALRWAEAHPALVRYSDNIRILEAIRQSGIGLAQDADALAELYRSYRKRVHQLDLQRQPARVPETEFADARRFVRDCWRRLFAL